MERIKQSQLETLVSRINGLSKSNSYSLEWSCGGVKLLKDDCREITRYRHTKKEMYHILSAIEDVLHYESK